MTTQDRHFSPQVLAADEGNDRYEGMPRRGSGFLDEPFRLGSDDKRADVPTICGTM